jgi:hypothetical protein
LTRREFLNVCKTENLKHIFGAVKRFQEGVKETEIPLSCDEVATQFHKERKRLHQHTRLKRNRKEGQSL